MQKNQKIPVTLLTGFLGAGKTTLLNRFISEQPNTRFAIIENEFGEVGIDGQLVSDQSVPMMEVSSGCLCCTVNDKLFEALESLYEQRDTFDHVVIETTGIADPAGVVAPFLTIPAVEKAFSLQNIICLTDARHLEASLEDRFETRQQITFADTILLNKQDLIEKTELTSLQDLLRGINPQAKIIPCAHAEVDTQVLIAEEAKQQRDAEQIINSHHHTHAQSGITTISFVFDQPFEAAKLEQWLNVLLTFQGSSIYRVKGTLYLTGTDRQVVFQSVRSQAAYTIGEMWQPGQKKGSQLVFIGQDLNREVLEENLKQCLTNTSEAILHSS